MTLIVVSGAPGTGKSTVARAVGSALRFGVLSLDPIKEALADVLGLGGPLVEVDTGLPGASAEAVAAVRAAVG